MYTAVFGGAALLVAVLLLFVVDLGTKRRVRPTRARRGSILLLYALSVLGDDQARREL